MLLCRPVVRLGSPLLPQVEDSILDQSHVARRRLQQCELVNERAFELGLAHVDRATQALEVVLDEGPSVGRCRRLRLDAVGRREQRDLNSVIKMVRLAKPVVVYFAPNKIFQTLRSAHEVRAKRDAST
jgi:hypothetical protein